MKLDRIWTLQNLKSNAQILDFPRLCSFLILFNSSFRFNNTSLKKQNNWTCDLPKNKNFKSQNWKTTCNYKSSNDRFDKQNELNFIVNFTRRKILISDTLFIQNEFLEQIRMPLFGKSSKSPTEVVRNLKEDLMLLEKRSADPKKFEKVSKTRC